jgi:EAL domain-containing protein (putative c-di-GMP-specific phosphodiesterase class I)
MKKVMKLPGPLFFFAYNANIPCVAEFVHNDSVETDVKALGIDYSQGYYFSEPFPLTY